MLFDTHAHYDDEKFDNDRHEVIEKVHREGVSYIVNVSSDVDSIKVSMELSQKYTFVYAAVGIHPHSAGRINDKAVSFLYEQAACDKVVAIGEIGLDYYYEFAPRETQIKGFIAQIGAAKELSLP